MALMSPVLIGGMALGAETGYWYFTQRKLQHAADVAAHAAGIRKRVGDTQGGVKAAALQVASTSGFLPIKDTTSTTEPADSRVVNLAVNSPPESGSLIGQSEAVEVIISETKPRLLSSIFSKEPVYIVARAVAELTGGTPACVVALSATSSKAVEVSGSSSVTLNGCGVAVNSIQPDAYYMPNSTASLTADCVSTVGGSSIKHESADVLSLKVCDEVQENAPKVLDPYASVPEPSIPLTCDLSDPTFDKLNPVNPGEDGVMSLCGKVTLKGSVTFPGGLYIIDRGELSINGGSIDGTDVTFFFANDATISLAGNPTIKLSAPTVGPYAGILFFGQRCTSDPTKCNESNIITGNSGSHQLHNFCRKAFSWGQRRLGSFGRHDRCCRWRRRRFTYGRRRS
jgi:hypothetical protein